jgi:hypothetical protein
MWFQLAKKARVYDGTAWQELASAQTDLTAYSTTAQTTAGFRNAIINGGFNIWQRSTSATISADSTYYAPDRFISVWSAGGATGTWSRQSFTPGINLTLGYEPTYFSRTSATSGGASTEIGIGQRIEDVRTFANQTVTLSFWAKADSSRTLTVLWQQRFGTGGSGNVASSTTKTLSTSWTRYTHTFTFPSISGKTVGTDSSIFIGTWFGAGQASGSPSLDIWGVQVEAGSVATPFEQRPIGTELALCQRYYWRVSGETAPYVGLSLALAAGGTTVRRLTVPLPVTMRIKPTVTKAGTHSLLTAGLSNRIFNTISGNNSSPNMISLDVTTTNTTTSGEVLMYIIDTASANDYLDASAEL